MPKQVKALSAIEIRRLNKRGFQAVGTVPGLGLMITPQQTKSWVYRVSYGGARRKMGLGGYPAVSLAQAIDKARAIKFDIDRGIDPIGVKKASKSNLIAARAKNKTFKECAELFLATRTFKSEKHRKQWFATLESYAYPHIGKLLINDIGIANIKAVLDPIWQTKTETASRLQGRIKSVIDYAIVCGYRDKANPAIWDGYLDSIYQSPKKLKSVEHMDAIPYSKVHNFVQALKTHDAISAKALEFLIHTAVRSDSVRSATWDQIDLNKRVWTIPKEHTKTKKRDHYVPLSDAVIQLLNSLGSIVGTDLVFPSKALKKMSDSAISKLMREMRANKEFDCEGVPHGFRSTFRVWCLEQTTYSSELAELSLMHEVGDAVYKAYQRSDGLERRRAIMQDWSNFIEKPYVEVTHHQSNIVELVRDKRA